MLVVVNGEDLEVQSDATVASVVARLCEEPRGVAVALNGEVVPKSTWSVARIAPHDALEILAVAAGG